MTNESSEIEKEVWSRQQAEITKHAEEFKNVEPLRTFPVDESIHVIDGLTLYKSKLWWRAALLLETRGHKQIAFYLWKFKSGRWKRQQKLTVKSKKIWEAMKKFIDFRIDRLKEVEAK